jgi:hypothetical protein
MAQPPVYEGGSVQNLHSAADSSVQTALSSARGLREFLEGITALTRAERTTIVEQAIVLLESFYVHLPLKRAMHAVDPLQRLRLLRRRLPQLPSEIAFHHEMTDIFTSLRDLHTNYLLPWHFAEMVAFLPFRIETCCIDGREAYIVAAVAKGFQHSTFVPGVEVTYWNAIPIERATEIAASYHAGSNPAARRARGVAGLTVRSLQIAPPPDEEWVTIGYRSDDGQELNFWAEWTISRVPEGELLASSGLGSDAAAAAIGLDLEGEAVRRVNQMLFAQHVFAARRRIKEAEQTGLDGAQAAAAASAETPQAATATSRGASRAQAKPKEIPSTRPGAFAARAVDAEGRRYGYVRIYTFAVPDDRPFVEEFLRLIEHPDMPRDGLIIDVRSNPGGLIWAGERLLQLLTPNRIEPCRVQFISSQRNLDLVSATPSLEQWLRSLRRALESGSTFSAAFPITPPDRCNDVGQRYYGPVVLVTDARCYSTTDIFAAGFQDHRIGKILGTDETTGAGGANVWELNLINDFFRRAALPTPLQELPKGASMRVAIRRTLRVGAESDTELEDFGVLRDERHDVTRNDVLNGNVDLIAKAASLLAGGPVRTFHVVAERIGEDVRISLSSHNVESVDTFVDNRPRHSKPVGKETLRFRLKADPGARLEFRGYSGGELVCCRLCTA